MGAPSWHLSLIPGNSGLGLVSNLNSDDPDRRKTLAPWSMALGSDLFFFTPQVTAVNIGCVTVRPWRPEATGPRNW